MPMFAMSDLLGCLADVFAVRNSLQVLRVNAPRCIALVMNFSTIWRRSETMFEHPTMYHDTP